MKQAIGVVVLAFGSCASPQGSGTKSPTALAPPAKPAVAQTRETAAGPVLADSPAAKAFKAWLEVFNSGDEARLHIHGATQVSEQRRPIQTRRRS
jgi:hypothetical protein